MQSPEGLTREINDVFDDQFSEQFIAVLVADSKPLALVIQLKKPPYHGGSYNPFPNYDDEITVIAKAMRVLIDLEESSRFFDYLKKNNIVNIMVTTAIDSRFVNNSNKWVSTAENAGEIVKGLLKIKAQDTGLFNSTFKSVVSF